MKIVDTQLDSVKIVEPQVFGDERGFFLESWNRKVFEDAGIPVDFVQDNHSRSSAGVLRGLHYQIRQPQGKLVRVSHGAVFDVAVDMRADSVQFGQWVGVELSESNKRQLWVPPGFAHGFLVLSEQADFQYKCTEYYAKEHERCLIWNDPEVGIQWPMIEGVVPVLSAKDSEGFSLGHAETFGYLDGPPLALSA